MLSCLTVEQPVDGAFEPVRDVQVDVPFLCRFSDLLRGEAEAMHALRIEMILYRDAVFYERIHEEQRVLYRHGIVLDGLPYEGSWRRCVHLGLEGEPAACALVIGILTVLRDEVLSLSEQSLEASRMTVLSGTDDRVAEHQAIWTEKLCRICRRLMQFLQYLGEYRISVPVRIIEVNADRGGNMGTGTEAAEIDRLVREERPRLSDGPGDLLQRAESEDFALTVIVEDECTEAVGVKGMGDRFPLPVADPAVAATRNHDHGAPLLSGAYRMRIAWNRYGIHICMHRPLTERRSGILSIGPGRVVAAHRGEGIRKTVLDGLCLCGNIQRKPTGGKRRLLGFLVDQFCIIYTCIDHNFLHPMKKSRGLDASRISVIWLNAVARQCVVHSIFHEILAIWCEDVDELSGLEADTAVLDAVGFQKGIALGDDVLLPINRELELTGLDIGDLGVRVMMELADGALIEGILDDHHIIGVRKDALRDAFPTGLCDDILIKYPTFILVLVI